MNEDTPSWLQRNAFLAAACGLPVVILLFFLSATKIPEWLVEDPAHDLVFSLTHYGHRGDGYALEFRVTDGRVAATAVQVPEPGYGTFQKLYRYRASIGQAEELVVALPDRVLERLDSTPAIAGQESPSASFQPEGLAGLLLATDRLAPDGYEFVHDDSRHRGLFGELFGMSRGRQRLGLTSNGRFVPITMPEELDPYRFRDATFLGWVVEP